MLPTATAAPTSEAGAVGAGAATAFAPPPARNSNGNSNRGSVNTAAEKLQHVASDGIKPPESIKRVQQIRRQPDMSLEASKRVAAAAETAEQGQEEDMVFYCANCRQIFGDSKGLVFAEESLQMLVFTKLSGVQVMNKNASNLTCKKSTG